MKIIQVMAVASMLIFSACGSTEQNENKQAEEETGEVKELTKEDTENKENMTMEKDGLVLYPAPSEVEYPTAKLVLKKPTTEENMKAGNVSFEFEVSDYELKGQTNGEKAKTLANSDKGQHIHFILNNAPYQAKYEPMFEAELMEGNNVVLAFLSKSFHESVKTETAYFFDNFYVGEGESDFDKNAQHLFYSRPKGEYKLEKAKKLLFDFYLMNTSLSKGGNQVKLMVDKTEFMISDWKVYFVEGLGVGEHTFRIQLLDKDGKMIEGPFNDSGVRKITITE